MEWKFFGDSIHTQTLVQESTDGPGIEIYFLLTEEFIQKINDMVDRVDLLETLVLLQQRRDAEADDD